tara:strand:+ start:8672 stop:10057 length:1386 start_codon:yes stop_codon:yes gene_type:complete
MSLIFPDGSRTETLPMGTPNEFLDNFKQRQKGRFGGGTRQGGIGRGQDRKQGRGRGKGRGRGRDGRGVDSFNPYDEMKDGWLDFYNDKNQRKINSGGGFTADGHWTGQGAIPTNTEGMQPLISSAPLAGSSATTNNGQRIDRGDLTEQEARRLGGPSFNRFMGAFGGSASGGGFGGTTKQGGAKKTTGDGNIPSDFGQYNPATFGGNLYNQGWGNMVNWGNKFKDNKAIQGFISGARLDSNQTMMNMGMDLLYQKGQMSQMADYHGGMENLKTGNTLKLLAAEGGITRDLMWDQGDILSRQIGERGDQDRRTLRATGQENRSLVMTQGDQDRRGQRVKGQEQRAGIMTQGKEDRKGLRVKGEEDRLGFRVSGEEDRLGMRVSGEEERLGMRVGGEEERAGIRTRGTEERLGKREQGAQDRMLTQERGSEERKTQRDRYREERGMRADARGAIRRSGSRFFG